MKQKKENVLENSIEYYQTLIEDKFVESTYTLVKFIQTISDFKYCYTNQFEKLFKLKTDIDFKMINCLSDIMEINDKKKNYKLLKKK